METRYTPEMIEEYTRKGYWSDRLISDPLEERARLAPDREAIADSRQRVTYAQMSRMVDRIALGLLELGIRKGDRVTVQFPNRVEGICTFYALGKIGAITCPVVPYYRGAEMRYILESSESVGVVIPKEFAGFDFTKMIAELKPGLPHLKHVIVAGDPVPEGTVSLDQMIEGNLESRHAPDYLKQFRPSADDVLAICYTSGTESAPKGPLWTHNTCNASVFYNASWRMSEGETVLNLLPSSHAFGFSQGAFLANMVVGARMVIMDAFDPGAALRLMQDEHVNAILAVPAQVIPMLSHPSLEKLDLSSMRMVGTAGSAMPPMAVRQIKEKMGCNFVNAWGMTECLSGTATCEEDTVEVSSGTIGRPVSQAVEMRVYSEDRGTVLPPGQPGEMAMRGPMVFAGYFKDPERTKQVFNSEGWFFTGDSVMVREDGNVSFVGRKKDIINRGGEKVNPLEVETLLFAHPKVLNVAVVGMPDYRLGERSCAYIIPKDGNTISFDEVVSFLREKKIATFKLPERVELVDSFPMTPTGKVKKNLLREDIADKLKTEVGA